VQDLNPRIPVSHIPRSHGIIYDHSPSLRESHANL
jgi:hypothetical protein